MVVTMMMMHILQRLLRMTPPALAIALIAAEAQRARPQRQEDEAQDERTGPRLAEPQEAEERKGFVGVAMQLKDAYQEDDLGTLAASLAYRFFLALFPFFIFLAALSGFVAAMLAIEDPGGQIIDLLAAALPPEAAELIGGQLGQVMEGQNPGLLSIGIIGAIWATASGIQSLMKAMNYAYGVPETRKWWKKYGLSIGLALLSGAFVIGAVVVLFTGQFLAADIAGAVGIDAGWVTTLIEWLRWPVMIVLLMAAIGFLYWACPNMSLPFKLVTPGAVLFVVLWIVAAIGFSFYVANFGDYNATYGALGGVVILLIWMYFTGLLLLLGAELNAILDERARPEEVRRQKEEKKRAAQQGQST